MTTNTPPVIRESSAYHAANAVILAFAGALAASVGLMTGIGFGAAFIFANASRHGRKLTSNDVARHALIFLCGFIGGQLIHDWPDVKTGFIEGYRQARGW